MTHIFLSVWEDWSRTGVRGGGGGIYEWKEWKCLRIVGCIKKKLLDSPSLTLIQSYPFQWKERNFYICQVYKYLCIDDFNR